MGTFIDNASPAAAGGFSLNANSKDDADDFAGRDLKRAEFDESKQPDFTGGDPSPKWSDHEQTFPNGNALQFTNASAVASGRVDLASTETVPDPLPPGVVLPPPSKFIIHSDRPRYAKSGPPWGGGYSLVFATPHPCRDIPRLRSSYNPVPYWLYTTEEFLNNEASAVVLTYPANVEAVQRLLLPVIGFPEPYTVLPVYESYGIHTDHVEVMVIARRPKPAPTADYFPLVKGQLQPPAEVAKKLQGSSNLALRLFPQDDSLLFDSPPHATSIFGPPPQGIAWPSGRHSPGCWRMWDE